MTDPVPLTAEEETRLREGHGPMDSRTVARLLATLDRDRAEANDALNAARMALTRADRVRSTPSAFDDLALGNRADQEADRSTPSVDGLREAAEDAAAFLERVANDTGYIGARGWSVALRAALAAIRTSPESTSSRRSGTIACPTCQFEMSLAGWPPGYETLRHDDTIGGHFVLHSEQPFATVWLPGTSQPSPTPAAEPRD